MEETSGSSPAYAHPAGNREYLSRELIPLLRHGLQELLHEVLKDQLSVASGLEWDEDGYLPRGWRPFSPLRWLGQWLKDQNLNKRIHVPTRTDILANAFHRLDVDGSGYLDAEKIISLIGQTDVEGDLVKAADLIAFWDINGKGQVEMWDFIETMPIMVMGMSDEEVENMLDGFQLSKHFLDCDTREEKLEFLFLSIDKDKSDTLSLDEIHRLAIKMDPSTTLETVKNTFKLLDKDDSGEVDKPEFVKVMLELLGHSNETSFDRKVGIMLKPPEATPSMLEMITPPKYSKLVASFLTQEDAHQIGCSELMRLMVEDVENLTIIDVRSQEERDVSFIKGSIVVDVVEDAEQPYGYDVRLCDNEELEAVFDQEDEHDEDDDDGDEQHHQMDGMQFRRTFVVVCNTGLRGGAAAIILSEEYNHPFHNLCGGLINYFNAGGELSTSSGELVEKLHPGSKQLAGYVLRKNEISIKDMVIDVGRMPPTK